MCPPPSLRLSYRFSLIQRLSRAFFEPWRSIRSHRTFTFTSNRRQTFSNELLIERLFHSDKIRKTRCSIVFVRDSIRGYRRTERFRIFPLRRVSLFDAILRHWNFISRKWYRYQKLNEIWKFFFFGIGRFSTVLNFSKVENKSYWITRYEFNTFRFRINQMCKYDSKPYVYLMF